MSQYAYATQASTPYDVDPQGYYGEFGGAFIPEMLHPNVEELRRTYLELMRDPSFEKEFRYLLKRLNLNQGIC